MSFVMFFFFKQKTAYEMRISDWSSDVCSSDLVGKGHGFARQVIHLPGHHYRLDLRGAHGEYAGQQKGNKTGRLPKQRGKIAGRRRGHEVGKQAAKRDRMSVVRGQRVSVRVDLGGRRNKKTQKNEKQNIDKDKKK